MISKMQIPTTPIRSRPTDRRASWAVAAAAALTLTVVVIGFLGPAADRRPAVASRDVGEQTAPAVSAAPPGPVATLAAIGGDGVGRVAPVPAWAATVTVPAYGSAGPLALRVVRDLWQVGWADVGTTRVPVYLWLAEDPAVTAAGCAVGTFVVDAVPLAVLDVVDRVWPCPAPFVASRIASVERTLVRFVAAGRIVTLDRASGTWSVAPAPPQPVHPALRFQ